MLETDNVRGGAKQVAKHLWGRVLPQKVGFGRDMGRTKETKFVW